MKNAFLIIVLTIFALSIANAQVPNHISWQGILQDTDGNVLDGNFDITFKLFDASTGGSELWTETHQNFGVVDGVVNLTLGSIEEFELLFNEQYWLEITVDGGTPLSRIKLNSVPYAMYAKNAPNEIVGLPLILKDSDGNIIMKFDPDNRKIEMYDDEEESCYSIQVTTSPLSLSHQFTFGDGYWGTTGFKFTNTGHIEYDVYPYFNRGLTSGNDIQGNGNLYIEGSAWLSGNYVDIGGDLMVWGDLNVEGTKNFRIDHPLDPQYKYLVHAAMESNEVLNTYSGNIITDNDGTAIVYLPVYFDKINTDFRYVLTVIGRTFARAIVYEEIENNQFTIKTDEPNVKVTWQVIARRNDERLRNNPFYDVINK